MVRVCFVCLGNICRSPTAEGMMRAVIVREGLEESIEIESAGTSGWHVGERPDPRSRAAAATRGVTIDGKSQHFTSDDFARFDYVLALDGANRKDLLALTDDPQDTAKVQLLLDFAPTPHTGEDVPDPYYGGASGFEHVLDLCEWACEGFLEELRRVRAI